MGDLISRDKAVAVVLGTSIEYQLIYGKKEPKEGFVRSLIKSLANIPQEETERKRGHWIEYPECLAYAGALDSDYIVCSECKAPFNIMENDAERFDFCPVCGARMDE